MAAGGGEVGLAGQSQETRARQASSGLGGEEEIMRRHPEFFGRLDRPRRHDQRDGGTGRFSPARAGREVTTATQAHALEEEDATTEDPAAAIERFTRAAARAPSYPARSPAQREAEERRALAGGGRAPGRSPIWRAGLPEASQWRGGKDHATYTPRPRTR